MLDLPAISLAASEVRRAQPADLPAVREVLASHWPQFADELHRSLDQLVASPTDAIFLNFAYGQPCGCVMMAAGEVAVIHALCIAPDFRRASRMCDLVQAGVQWARAERVGCAVLACVLAQDRPQIDRFARLGFVRKTELDRPSIRVLMLHGPLSRS